MKVSALLFSLNLYLLVVVTLVGGEPSPDKWAVQLPDGDGKALVIDACVQCHTLESTVLKRRDRAGWQKTVNDMILRGAFITPVDAEAIVAYLAAALGRPVNLNRATLEELLRSTSLERTEAEAILRHRNRHGPFRSVDDLREVKELKPERFEKIKGQFSISSPAPPSVSGSKPD